ncbi:MAG: transposase [Ruminococcus sp.]|nr:transposase [Ruminococcus sp.]
MNNSIHHSEEICNRLNEKFTNITPEKYLQHIISIIIAIFCLGYKGKTVNFELYSDCHRTTISRFLRDEKWDDTPLAAAMKTLVISIVYDESRSTGKPVLVIIDDTISSKTKPSSRAKHPIEGAYFHFSHLKKKQDYGHQAVAVLLSCNGITLEYTIEMYDKTVSKIGLVERIAGELPDASNGGYLLCDSWYVCRDVIESFAAKGFCTIGALKTNRVVYPDGAKMNVADYARLLSDEYGKTLFDLVTVRKQKYYVYRYEGRMNGIQNGVVLLTYPVGAFGKESALRAFISTDSGLSTEEILELYVHRWEIEVFFRTVKNKLAFDKYQIRSAVGVRRFWLLTSLAYLLACLESDTYDFDDGYHRLSAVLQREHIGYLYELARVAEDKSTFLAMVA